MDVIRIVSLVFVCIIAICILKMAMNIKKEGFYANSLQGDYEALRVRLKTMLRSYCQLSTYVTSQMKELYMAPKLPDDIKVSSFAPAPPPPPPYENASATTPTSEPVVTKMPEMPSTITGDTELQAEARMEKTYNEIYACTDERADKRPLCVSKLLAKALNPKLTLPTKSEKFTPCDNFMNLPNWPDQMGAAIKLANISDNLAENISMEIEWYTDIVKTLTDAIAMGANPPSKPPDSANSPSTNASGKPWSTGGKEGFAIEGFAGAKCSASAQQALLERSRRAALDGKGSGERPKPDPADDPETCQMPSLPEQIRRVNSILNNPALANALKRADSLRAAMLKLEADQKLLKAGNLYEWQKDGPRKSYEIFKGGDRFASFLQTLKQAG